MKLVRLAAAAAAVVTAAVPLALAGPAATASAAPAAGESVPAAVVPLLAGPSVGQTVVADDGLAVDGSLVAAPTATFKVTYNGFSPQAKAAFQRAVDTWATQVRSSVPITINATFRPLGANVLGSAGPSLVHRDFAGAPQKGVYYADALANKLAGRQLAGSADIVANFSSSFPNWYYGTGATPRGDYDFQSVVLHELGHGLGFLGASSVSGGSGSVRLQGTPLVYSRFTENGAGKALLTYADPSAALKQQLTGGNVFFDSPKVRSANGGQTAELYAPGTYQPGSSYSHLDERRYGAGNRNSLMTPAIGAGEQIHSPGPITKALFSTIGW